MGNCFPVICSKHAASVNELFVSQRESNRKRVLRWIAASHIYFTQGEHRSKLGLVENLMCNAGITHNCRRLCIGIHHTTLRILDGQAAVVSHALLPCSIPK